MKLKQNLELLEGESSMRGIMHNCDASRAAYFAYLAADAARPCGSRDMHGPLPVYRLSCLEQSRRGICWEHYNANDADGAPFKVATRTIMRVSAASVHHACRCLGQGRMHIVHRVHATR